MIKEDLQSLIGEIWAEEDRHRERRSKLSKERGYNTKGVNNYLQENAANKGRIMFRAGKPVRSNPYSHGSKAHALWCFGWRYEAWLQRGIISRQEAGLPPLDGESFCCASTSCGLGPGA